MLKLLHANIYRLIRDKVFYAELILTAALSIFIVFANYAPKIQATENRLYLDDVFFTMYQLMGFILAAGISLIVGTEYSDGTMRNKLMIGSTRTQVYFSHLITCIVPSCLVLIVHGVITYGLGNLLFGNFQMQAAQVMTALLCALLGNLVFSALFAAIALNCSNKAITAVASLLLILGLTFLSAALGNALAEPEMAYDGITISVDGGLQLGDLIPNPAYVTGMEKTIYEVLYDLFPTGQLIQIYGNDFSRCVRWPLFSGALLILITMIGFLLFRKRDIK